MLDFGDAQFRDCTVILVIFQDFLLGINQIEQLVSKIKVLRFNALNLTGSLLKIKERNHQILKMLEKNSPFPLE